MRAMKDNTKDTCKKNGWGAVLYWGVFLSLSTGDGGTQSKYI